MKRFAVGMSLLLCVCPGAFTRAAERVHILIADFEGKDYGAWKVTGEAFGPGPAQGTLPNQMPVTGFKGKRLVNSYYGGDKSTGTLTSPAFKVERGYINFLIGGGKHPGKTEPVKEIETIHDKKHAWSNQVLKPGDNLLAGITGDLFEIRAEFRPADAKAFGFLVRGVPVVYDVVKKELSCNDRSAPLPAAEGNVRWRLLIDRGSIGIFGNGGGMAMSVGVIPPDDKKTIEIFSRGGRTRLRALEVFELKSAYSKQ